jgi:triosephosphate isomerase
LKVLIFASDPEKVADFGKLSPDFIAYEPPELIGGEISVTSAKPKIISEAVTAAGRIPLLIGAGIHEKSDIIKALELGAIGAVVSSAVVTATDPEAVFADLLSGLKR